MKRKKKEIFNSDSKEDWRADLVVKIKRKLNGQPFKGVLLETSQLLFIKELIKQEVEIHPHTTIVEYKKERYEDIYDALIDNNIDICVLHGLVEEILPELPNDFNCLLLDFCGHITKSREELLYDLPRKLTDSSVIILTYPDGNLQRNRSKRSGVSNEDPLLVAFEFAKYYKKHGWNIWATGGFPYKGKATEKGKETLMNTVFITCKNLHKDRAKREQFIFSHAMEESKTIKILKNLYNKGTFTYDEIADPIGVSKGTIGHLMTGRTKTLRPNNMAKLEKVLKKYDK